MKLHVAVLDKKLIHRMSVNNNGDKPMPIAYGIHPYFQIRQEEKAELKTNIIGFAPQEINWLEEFDQAFTNPGQTTIGMPAKEMKIENDADIFRFIRIWHQPGKNFICIEPWTRDNYALDNPVQSLWIEPQKTVKLAVTFAAE
jgi:galactose mutarotase-like enzyme